MDSRTDVTVGSGPVRADVIVTVRQSYQLVVTVLDERGRPAAMAQVTSEQGFKAGQTDAHGRFRATVERVVSGVSARRGDLVSELLDLGETDPTTGLMLTEGHLNATLQLKSAR
jgi:hypothetical protein